MSRAARERERQARRQAYLAASTKYPPASRVVVRLGDGESECFTVTKEDITEFEDESTIALHEASHAVAAWMLGVHISRMQFSDHPDAKKSRDSTGKLYDGFVASVATGAPRTQRFGASFGERVVDARQSIFITLAGIVGDGSLDSANPLVQRELKSHLGQATSIYVALTAATEEEAREDIKRILPVVIDAFDDRRVRYTRDCLAINFLRLRVLSGEQVTDCISQAWEQFNETAKAATAGK